MVFRTAICLLGLLSTSHFLRATEYVIPQSEFFGTNDHLSVIQEALDNYDVVVLSDYANMAAPNSPDNSGLWSVWRVGNPVIISGGKTVKLNKNVCLAAKKIGKFNEFNKRVGVVEFAVAVVAYLERKVLPAQTYLALTLGSHTLRTIDSKISLRTTLQINRVYYWSAQSEQTTSTTQSLSTQTSGTQ